jgi:hypothetical protein
MMLFCSYSLKGIHFQGKSALVYHTYGINQKGFWISDALYKIRRIALTVMMNLMALPEPDKTLLDAHELSR